MLLQLGSVRPATLYCGRLPASPSSSAALTLSAHASDHAAAINVPGGAVAISVAAIGVPRRAGLLVAWHRAVDGARRVEVAELAIDWASLGGIRLAACAPIAVPQTSREDGLTHLAWTSLPHDGDTLALVVIADDDEGSAVNSWRFEHVADGLSEGFAGLGTLQNGAPTLSAPTWSSQLRSAVVVPRVHAASARVPSRPGVLVAVASVAGAADETPMVEAICVDAATLEPVAPLTSTRFPRHAVGRGPIALSPNGAQLVTGLAMIVAPVSVGGVELALAVLRRTSAHDIGAVLQHRGGVEDAVAAMWSVLASMLGARPRPDRTWACIDLLRAEHAVISLDTASTARAATIRTILALHASHATFASAMAQLRGGAPDERTFNTRAGTRLG